VDSLYRIAPLVAAAGVGRVPSNPFGITKTFVELILTEPVPAGVNTISPLLLTADIVLAAILRLPNVEPPVVTVVTRNS